LPALQVQQSSRNKQVAASHKRLATRQIALLLQLQLTKVPVQAACQHLLLKLLMT
jgi:hypothetical protein